MASISLKYKSKQGSLTAPGDVDPGAMIPIATTVVGSGNSSSIDFTSIPQNYEHLQIRIIAKGSTGGQSILVTFNSDTTGSNYARHRLTGDGSSTSASGTADSASYVFMSTGISATANIFSAGILDILDYTNTNKYTTTRFIGGTDYNGSGNIDFSSSLWKNTAAITSISLSGVTFNQYSSFTLYGIKRAGA